MLEPISLLPANTPMPDLFGDSKDLLRLEPSAYYDTLDQNGIRLWCHYHGRYGLPTVELIEWLSSRINTKRAIEIGAGCGDLCHHLGIPGTDSYQQRDNPFVAEIYRLAKQPVIQYGRHVVKIEAEEAIRWYEPEIVIGSWVTQWIDPNLPFPSSGGNIYGIKEDEIISAGITYILIGNLSVHGGKNIMSIPHEEFKLPFLRSRSVNPDLDRIWIWNG